MAGLIAAMEEIENEIPVNESEAAETAVAVADESAEIQQDSDEIGTTVTQVEDAVQAGDELESIGEVAVDAVESGEGLTEEAAEVASIAIESIRNRLGFRATTRLVPATESFGNTNTRVMSTRLVIEGIGDTLKKIWAAIKAAALRVWDMIKSFVAKLFGSVTMLSKHIAALKERALKLPTDAQLGDKTIKTGVAKVFSVDGKADQGTVNTIIENTKRLAEVAGSVGQHRKVLANSAKELASKMTPEQIKTFMVGETKGADDIVKSASVLHKIDAKFWNLPTNIDAKSDDKVSRYGYGPFINHQILMVEVTEGKALGNDVKHATIKLVKGKDTAASEIEALDVAGVKAILAKAETACKELEAYKKINAAQEDVVKATVATADAVMRQAEALLKDEKDSVEAKAALKELQSYTKNAISGMASFANTAPAVSFAMVKGLADYASVSMRNLKVK